MSYKDMFSLGGKVAVVTGGAGLLGSEIVKGLAEFGALVYIADVDAGKAKSLLSDRVKFIEMDIASEQSVEAALKEVASEKGRLDVLVNCAYPRTADWGAKFEDIKLESWNKNVEAHLGGYFISSRIAAEMMKRKGGGSIINLASIYGVSAPDFSVYEGTDMTMPAAYAPIKSGIIALTKYIASYYGPHKVRANTISPGGILDGQLQSFVKEYSSRTPLGRMGSPADVVGAAVFLASDASSYVTGHNLMVDGGWTAR